MEEEVGKKKEEGRKVGRMKKKEEGRSKKDGEGR